MKFFKSIRKRFVFSNNFSKYLRYAIGEIILVVIGILIALQINNWNSNRLKKNDAVQIYKQIKRNVEDDRAEIVNARNLNNFFSSQFQKANRIIASRDRDKMDSLAILVMQLSQYSDFHGTGKIYENLVNSGDIKLLHNQEITSRLQKLEMTYSNINKLEDIHWEIIIKELSPELKGVINYSNLQVVRPDKLFSVEIQNFVIESIFLTSGKDSIYSRAITEIDHLTELISQETLLPKKD